MFAAKFLWCIETGSWPPSPPPSPEELTMRRLWNTVSSVIRSCSSGCRVRRNRRSTSPVERCSCHRQPPPLIRSSRSYRSADGWSSLQPLVRRCSCRSSTVERCSASASWRHNNPPSCQPTGTGKGRGPVPIFFFSRSLVCPSHSAILGNDVAAWFSYENIQPTRILDPS